MFWLEIFAAFDEKGEVVRWEQVFPLVFDANTDDFCQFFAKEDVKTFPCRGNKRLFQMFFGKDRSLSIVFLQWMKKILAIE